MICSLILGALIGWIASKLMGSRVLFMDAGRIAEQGTPADVFDHPQSPRLQDFLKKVL